jgi:hypothetical protein
VITWENEHEFWQAAARSIPFWRRFLGRSATVEQVEAEAGRSPDWQRLRQELRPGDRIWAFEFNRRTLAYRRGFVVLRQGKPVGGVVALLS